MPNTVASSSGISSSTRGSIASGRSTPRNGGSSIEKGSASGIDFKNTTRYQSTFSSKGFASIGKGERVAGTNIPFFSINAEGVITQKAGKIDMKKAPTQNKSLIRQFGPKLEVTKGISPDRRVSEPITPKNSIVIFDNTPNRESSPNPLNKPTIEVSRKNSSRRELFSNPQTRVVINKRGNIIPSREGFTLPQQTRQAFAEKTSYIPVTRDGKLRESSKENNPIVPNNPSSETTKTRNLSRTSVDTAVRAREMLQTKSNKKIAAERLQHAAQTVRSKRELPTAQKGKLATEQPKPILSEVTGKTAQAEQRLLRAMDQKSTVTVPQQEAAARALPDVALSEKKVVTTTERQVMLDRYIAMQTHAQLSEGQHLASVNALPQETRKDVEQAVRVQHMVRLAYPQLSEQQSQELALRALNIKLEKTHTKDAVLEVGEVAKSTDTLLHYKDDELEMYETPAMADITAESLPGYEIAQTTQKEAGVQTVTDAETELTISSDTKTGQVTPVTSQQIDPLSSAIEGEEVEKETDEENDQEALQMGKETDWTKELEIPYERYEKKDKERQEVAITFARILQGDNKGQLISGREIAEAMKEFYDVLKSPIVPDDTPDDYLTNIINEISTGNFVSVENVATKVAFLTFSNPAITIGIANNISKDEAERLKRSTNYPS